MAVGSASVERGKAGLRAQLARLRPRISLAVCICVCIFIVSNVSVSHLDLRKWTPDMTDYNIILRSSSSTAANADSLQLEDLPRVTFPHGYLLFGHDSHRVKIPSKMHRSWTPQQAELLNDNGINITKEEERCKSYGYTLPPNPKRRRLFFGALLADDSLEVLSAIGTEAYDIFHTAAFVESNTTFNQSPRELKCTLRSKRQRTLYQLFGSNTKVSVDYYIATPDEQRGGDDMFREQLQRDAVQYRWRRNGMRPDDLAILGDSDETFTRDFLRAMQICDVPQFRPGQDCRAPKIIASTMVLESSPECIDKDRRWFHPDAMVGECIELIGNETIHPHARRQFHAHKTGQPNAINTTLSYGDRMEGQGPDLNHPDDEYEDFKNGGPYPLWTSEEIRTGAGGEQIQRTKKSDPTGFHLHNFFEDAEDFRLKYTTYGHANATLKDKPLWELQDDINLGVKCAENMTTDDFEPFGTAKNGEVRPIYYLDESVRTKRHALWQSIVEGEKKRFAPKQSDISNVGATVPVPEQSPRRRRPPRKPAAGTDWKSVKSAVIGMATHTDFRQMVLSLRATGFRGQIILGVSTLEEHEKDFLKKHRVTAKVVEDTLCTYNGTIGNEGVPIDTTKYGWWNCPNAYPDYKITHARFIFYRDWINECKSCTDGIVLTDVADSFFQRDPFVTAVRLNMQHPVMVFEEISALDNTHWLTDFPVKSCRNYTVGPVPMLCSGSTMGSREGILAYLDAMVEEFDYWKTREECRIDMPGDDQSIHNYLFYTGRLKDAVAIPHRTGPLHIVGYEASELWNKNATLEAKDAGIEDLFEVKGGFYVTDDKWQDWLPRKYNLTDPETGLILNFDGMPSAQVHQEDRFGSLHRQWKHEMMKRGWPYNKPSD